jgi:hypothetical protein
MEKASADHQKYLFLHFNFQKIGLGRNFSLNPINSPSTYLKNGEKKIRSKKVIVHFVVSLSQKGISVRDLKHAAAASSPAARAGEGPVSSHDDGDWRSSSSSPASSPPLSRSGSSPSQ